MPVSVIVVACVLGFVPQRLCSLMNDLMTASPPGAGVLETARAGDQTIVLRARATAPLRLLCPRRGASAAWVYASSYGGGLVGGDHTRLRVDVQPGSQCVLCTQASTKVYRCGPGKQCRQEVEASVGRDGLLVVAPDPITCFADAWYQQQQSFCLQEGGNLVLVDWVTSGRHARNEVWEFAHYATRFSIEYAGRLVVADALVLDPAQGPLRSPYRVGRFHCLATMVVLGDQLTPLVDVAWQTQTTDTPQQHSRQIETVSSFDGGVILRVAGMSTEGVFRTLQQRLSFLEPLLGDAPWSRKW